MTGGLLRPPDPYVQKAMNHELFPLVASLFGWFCHVCPFKLGPCNRFGLEMLSWARIHVTDSLLVPYNVFGVHEFEANWCNRFMLLLEILVLGRPNTCNRFLAQPKQMQEACALEHKSRKRLLRALEKTTSPNYYYVVLWSTRLRTMSQATFHEDALSCG